MCPSILFKLPSNSLYNNPIILPQVSEALLLYTIVYIYFNKNVYISDVYAGCSHSQQLSSFVQPRELKRRHV